MNSAAKNPIRAFPRIFLAFLAASLFWLHPVAGPCATFRYTDLHPAGWISSAALCVNDSGEVAGYGAALDGERGFAWSAGTFREVLPPGADSARANWINGRGEVAGTRYAGGVPHAFLLRDGEYLDPTPGWGWSEAAYVGEDGAVAGAGEFGAYISRGGVTEIFPGFSSVAMGNSSGQWVGSSGASSLLYLPGRGYLDVTPPGATASDPRGINESGIVAVVAQKTGMTRGYVKSGEFYIDMTPPGWSSSRATAINDFNAVAGYGDSGAGTRSFLRSGGSTEEIVFPGWKSTEAVSLNNAGRLAGSGMTAEGETHAFLASPTVMSSSGSPASAASPGSAGGCSLAHSAGSVRSSSSPAAAIFLLLFPLFLVRRQGRKDRRSSSEGSLHSPRILTSTRFLRRPSNSP